MLSFFQSKELINRECLKSILDKVVSPKMQEIGLHWDKNYTWFSEKKGFTTFILKYEILKGETGTFTWGINIDFVPRISNTKIIYPSKSDCLKPNLFEWVKGFSANFDNETFEEDPVTHWGKKRCEKSVVSLLKRYETEIKNWLDKANSLSGIFDLTEKQVKDGGAYNFHDPNPKIVYAFLLAKKGQKNESEKLINETLLNIDEKELYIKEINKLY